ncbi:uncharacterized protein FFMR_01637 [Fusarium fujikuroi]|nr:uncharacterized protein FFMR_01637 [Fusarium fujikuroi]
MNTTGLSHKRELQTRRRSAQFASNAKIAQHYHLLAHMRKSIATRPSGMSVMIYSNWFIFVDCTLSQSFVIDDEPQNDPSIHSPTPGAEWVSRSFLVESTPLSAKSHCNCCSVDTGQANQARQIPNPYHM